MLVIIQRMVLQEKEPCFVVFPWSEHAHHGQFQTTNVTSLSVKLERDVHSWFLGSCELGRAGSSTPLEERWRNRGRNRWREGWAGNWTEG